VFGEAFEKFLQHAIHVVAQLWDTQILHRHQDRNPLALGISWY